LFSRFKSEITPFCLTLNTAGSLKDDLSLPKGSKLAFVKRDMDQTNEQQRQFNKWPTSK
jgi:hypothetical protein